jgi:hypothetical protein
VVQAIAQIPRTSLLTRQKARRNFGGLYFHLSVLFIRNAVAQSELLNT